MKRIDIALISSGLAIMGLSGYMTLAHPEASYWVNLTGLGALQTAFGTLVMILRFNKSVERKLAETEER
jgi:hypothetical protein